MLASRLHLRFYLRTIARLLYPAHCAVCRLPLLIEEMYLCGGCKAAINWIGGSACLRCALPLPPYAERRSLCASCQSERPYFNRGFALAAYDERVRPLFHRIKYGSEPWLLSVFSDRASAACETLSLTAYDLVVPIPLDPARERKRGFNQSLLIGKMLKRSLKSKPPLRNILKKTKKTPPQSELAREDRLENLKGAFSLRRRANLCGAHVLLVDDILTTGSTVNECAKTLKENGAAQVDFFTLARTNRS